MIKVKLIIFLFLLISSSGFIHAQIAFANGWNSTTSAPNVTTAAAGSNRLLLYIITYEDDDNTNDVTSVTYGGQSMTQIVQTSTFTGGGSQSRVEMWSLNNTGITAATHTTFIPVFSISNPTTSHGYYTMAVTLTGVNQSTPVCTTGTGQRLTSSTVNLSSGISVLPSEVVIYATHGGDSRTHTPATGYTERVDLNGAGGGQSSSVNTKSITTAATENPTSTASGSQNRFVIAAIRLIPNGASCTSALPIELSNFELKPGDQQVEVNWKTYSELNNAYFAIERSANGLNWEEIGRVKGAGTSKVIKKYHYSDNFPLQDLAYYRLKQIDFDGSHDYSWIETIKLQSNVSQGIKIYPNPAESEILVFGDAQGISITNSLGLEVTGLLEIMKEDKYLKRVNISKLESGTYYFKSGLCVLKFIKL
ncbi:MAG: hypothetical protein IT236_11905 [Bacteroidia bacterium]|nr:hypothetical protein [Bacteroidia bacterium]